MALQGELSKPGHIKGTLTPVRTITGSLQIPVYKPYNGEYTITSTESEQVVSIEGQVATNNIVINPIPNNYGLITWNGSVITVS